MDMNSIGSWLSSTFSSGGATSAGAANAAGLQGWDTLGANSYGPPAPTGYGEPTRTLGLTDQQWGRVPGVLRDAAGSMARAQAANGTQGQAQRPQAAGAQIARGNPQAFAQIVQQVLAERRGLGRASAQQRAVGGLLGGGGG